MSAGEQPYAAAAEAIDPVEAVRLEWAEVLEDEAARFARFSDRVPYGRIKTGEDDMYGHPICVPLLGAGHVTFAYRQRMDCRPPVRSIMANVLARTVADQPFGTVDITVSDHSERGVEFSRLFRALNVPDRPGADDRYHFRPNSELSEVVQETLDYLNMRRSGHADIFGGYNSYREAVEGGQQPAVPWRIVALVRRPDERLDALTLAALEEIAQHGVQYGISLMCGGLGLSNGYVTELKVLNERWVQHVPLPIPDQAVYLYTTPGEQEVMSAIADSKERQIKPGRSPDGQGYVHLVTGGLQRITEAQRAMRALTKDLPEEFPYLDPAFIQQWLASDEDYMHSLGPIFAPGADPGVALKIVSSALEVANIRELLVPKLTAWAMYHLSLANQPIDDRRIPRDIAGRAQKLLTDYLPHLHDLALRIMDLSSLPGAVAPYIERQLPEKPPAWLFQLLADAAFPDENFLPEGRFMERVGTVGPAVTAYLVRKYYPEDYHPNTKVPSTHPVRLPDVRGVLLELTLMDFYNFTDPQTPHELCDALVWRAAFRLRAMKKSINELPDAGGAKHMYRVAMGYLGSKDSIQAMDMTARAA